MYDYLIVGAGLFGSTFAYLAKQAGYKVLVIDKRSHVGGNVYCKYIKGINVHRYGAHIFHTSEKWIWDFVNQFCEFNNFVNSPIANYKGELYNLPFNMNTFNKLWHVKTPKEAEEKISSQKENVEPKNLEQKAISLVGKDVYEKLIKGYTEKQWGRKCAELPPDIITRIPVRYTFDNNYFNDKYQGIPNGGYNALIDALLQGCDVLLNTSYFDDVKRSSTISKKILFTGCIDEFYNYRYGKLVYRSVRFEDETYDVENLQGNAVVNYTDSDTPYTRIIEHKHFEPEGEGYKQPFTIISKEFPIKNGDPCYPVRNEENEKLYNKYKALADKEEKVLFGGRLAEYKYYDMDDTIKGAFELWQKNSTKQTL